MISFILWLGLLTKAIFDAHVKTRLYSEEQIEQFRNQPMPYEAVEMLKSLVRIEKYCEHCHCPWVKWVKTIGTGNHNIIPAKI